MTSRGTDADPMQRTRDGIAPFVIADPGLRALVGSALDQAPAWTLDRLRALARRATGELADEAALARTVADALRVLPVPRAHPVTAGRDPHDAYFGIGRAAAATPLSLAGAAIQALRVHLDETRALPAPHRYGMLGAALVRIWCDALELDVEVPLPLAQPPLDHAAPDPLRRWVLGHQVFAVVTQGLVAWFDALDAAMGGDAAQRPAACARAMTRIADLYRVSAAAFRFAADFAPEVYRDVIRPSMHPPFVPDGFSGALSVDHAALVVRMRAMRDVLAAAGALCPAEQAAMSEALAHLYDDHRLVCERFTDAQAPSLRSGLASVQRAAVHVLDQFKTHRLSMLAPVASPPRRKA